MLPGVRRVAADAQQRACRPSPTYQPARLAELPALLDHPFDHPDDPSGSFWILLDPSGSFWILLESSSPTRSIRLVIGRSRVRIPPRAPKSQVRAPKQDEHIRVDQVVAT